ncbi:MAG: sigma-70 family RNA polymerase sigma factor [Pirellulales bacterium]|nr:sigma-70 family RNA polymerase sigma factor [Pirellulales bacterium]
MDARTGNARETRQREAEFIKLWQTHRARLRGYVRASVHHPADVDEILQETSIVLWEKLSEFTPGTSFFAWAVSVARFEILRFRQKSGNRTLMFGEPAIEALAARSAARAPRYDDFWEMLGQCMKGMTDRQRDFFHRRFILNETPREIAKQMERPPTTIYSALQKLRRQLAECLSRRFGWETMP